jgi:histidinol-phosphate aminotransferase
VNGVRPNILAMAGYTPGEQLNDPDIIKLNTNENPYPPSPRVFEAIQAALNPNKLRKYPQPLGDSFRKAASQVLGIDPDCILIGNGSDDLLTILTRAFAPEGSLLASPTPSYILYRSLAEIQGTRFEAVPFTHDWKLPSTWVRSANLTFLPNPNSPSGTMVPLSEIVSLANSLAPSPLVLDEAYVDFADWNGLELLPKLSNLIITRSFSKTYSLAGMRFGFAIAGTEIIRELVKVKDSYNCDVLSLAAATAAIEDGEYLHSTRAKILITRARMSKELTKLGFEVTPSQANFLWCRSNGPAKPIYEELKNRKILVRYMNYPIGPTGTSEGSYDGLRISVGTDQEIDRLLEEISKILG